MKDCKWIVDIGEPVRVLRILRCRATLLEDENGRGLMIPAKPLDECGSWLGPGNPTNVEPRSAAWKCEQYPVQ